MRLPNLRALRRGKHSVTLETNNHTQPLTRTVKRWLIGSPIPSQDVGHTKMKKRIAFPVFTSDGQSSTAYASQEILIYLAPFGTLAFVNITPITIGIILLLVIVGASYRQAIPAYPQGGGAYNIAKENLGIVPALMAGAGLIIAYILTSAVSMSSAVENAYSVFHSWEPYRVYIAVGMLILLIIGNLRGFREAGLPFAIPSYFFLIMFGGMGLYGMYLWSTRQLGKVSGLTGPLLGPHGPVDNFAMLTYAAIIFAYVSGCTALTGAEVVLNGVPMFKDDRKEALEKGLPEAVAMKKKTAIGNAQFVMNLLVATLSSCFFVTSFLALVTDAQPRALSNGLLAETIPSQLARTIFGAGSPLFYCVQLAVVLILVMGSNTPFAGCPPLTSSMANDGYLPKQFRALGAKLVYSYGILFVGISAILLVIVFKASATAMLPMYAMWVFQSFTLSQAGMVRYWFRNRPANWQWKAAINGLGALVTFCIFWILAISKFKEGGYISVTAWLLLMPCFALTKWHYSKTREGLSHKRHLPESARNPAVILNEQGRIANEEIVATYLQTQDEALAGVRTCRHVAVVLIGAFSYVEREGLMRAMDIYGDCIIALHVNIDAAQTKRVSERWAKWYPGVKLTIIDSPERYLDAPIINLLHRVRKEVSCATITVVMPVFTLRKMWHNLLHGQTAFFLRQALYRAGVFGLAITSIPRELEELINSQNIDTATS